MSASAISEHDQAFTEAKQEALDRYSGMSRDYLLREQARLRAEYSMPTHSIVASLEVLHELLS